MVVTVSATLKLSVYQLLGGLLGCRPGHHPTVRPHPPTLTFLNNDGHKAEKLELAYYAAFPDRADKDLRFENQILSLS
jgi:hypothetical protein